MMTRASLGFVALGAFGLLLGCAGSEEADPPKKNPTGSSGSLNTSGSSNSSGSTGQSGSPTSNGGSSSAGTGSSDAGSAPVAGGDACAPAPDDCTASSAAGSLPFADFGSEQGFYLFANADDPMGTTTPEAGLNLVPEEIVCPAGGLCGGAAAYAMHVSGGGFTTYGPSLSKDHVYPSTATPGTYEGMAQDVSTYTGIQFWARKGSATGNPQIGVTLNDDTSSPAAGLCDETATPGAAGSKACFDGFYAKVSATSSWKLYKIPFSMLKQQGFGNKAADGMFHADKLHGVSFNLPMQTFDLWIGNVSFYQ